MPGRVSSLICILNNESIIGHLIWPVLEGRQKNF